jgi:hypothetical protein
MGTFLRESSTVVKRARIWVIAVAKAMCQVVRNSATSLSVNLVALYDWWVTNGNLGNTISLVSEYC